MSSLAVTVEEPEVTISPVVRALVLKVKAGFAPPIDLTVSEFSDRELVVTAGPLAGTRWQTAFAPYQRGIMDVFSEPGVEIAAVMGSSQWGKTAVCVNLVAYHIAHDPCPILIVEPTVKPMAEDFAKNRLDPVIAASPILFDRVSKKRAKDSSNTILAKSFRGGSLAVGGANSAASLAARSTRLLVLDEVDRYPAELPGEGSTIAIAMKRTISFGRRRRVMMTSSPTLKGATIDQYFQRGDQRRYFVPCPSCGVMHTFEWKNVKWKDRDPSTAHLECPECGGAISEAQRLAILGDGEWRATAESKEPGLVSFHLWEAYSPVSDIRRIVSGFLQARDALKSGDRSEMHTWQNTTLGEPIEPDDGDGAEPHVLLMRREPWAYELPSGVVILTMGVDVQNDRLEALVFGWGPGEECWIVDRQILPGDPDRQEPWAMLSEVLAREYVGERSRLQVAGTCIDSAGNKTTAVYDYVGAMAARRVYAIIGRDGQRPIVSSPSPRQWGQQKRKVPLYTIGVDAAKSLIVSRLMLTESGPGFVHIPHADWADEELANQLTSERLVTKKTKGIPEQSWKKIRRRNEGLDCFVYGLGALRLLHPNLDAMSQGGGGGQQRREPRKSGWFSGRDGEPRGPRRGGWLNR